MRSEDPVVDLKSYPRSSTLLTGPTSPPQHDPAAASVYLVHQPVQGVLVRRALYVDNPIFNVGFGNPLPAIVPEYIDIDPGDPLGSL